MYVGESLIREFHYRSQSKGTGTMENSWTDANALYLRSKVISKDLYIYSRTPGVVRTLRGRDCAAKPLNNGNSQPSTDVTIQFPNTTSHTINNKRRTWKYTIKTLRKKSPLIIRYLSSWLNKKVVMQCCRNACYQFEKLVIRLNIA